MIKNFILLCLISSSVLLAQTDLRSPLPVSVMTYNIRLDLASDGENSWNKRKENFCSMIRYHKADIVGLQEAFRNQLDDIIQELPEYGWCGVGRDDGKNSGEFMAVLYRKERFDTIRTSTFWCSETPGVPGRGWDAAFNRVVTWGKFYDTKNKNSFFLFNTHLDNEGKTARWESARLLIDSIAAITGKEPVVITGDFNSFPADEPYRIITAEGAKKKFFDARAISQQKPHGPKGTFNGFDRMSNPEEPIDYIFVSKYISVISHGVLSEYFNGRFPSDHFPVKTELIITKRKK